MSPDAQKPSTQTGSEKFQEGIHPTDGVRPFKQGDLQDVHERLLERGVPEVSPIDPHTLDVAVDKVPLLAPEKTEKKSRTAVIGAAIGGAVLSAAAVLTFNALGDKAPEAPTTSATEAPAAEETTQAESPEAPASSIELSGIMTQPSAEVINYVANTPILVEGKPNAAGALQATVTMGDYMNIYRNGGQLGDFVDLTPESEAIGESIITNVYGPAEVRNASNIDFQKLADERKSIANAFATYPPLESNRRWQPVEGTTPTVDPNNPELWNVDIQNISSGNWDVVGETPERNSDYEGTIQLGTYESPQGLAWYLYQGNTVPTAGDIS